VLHSQSSLGCTKTNTNNKNLTKSLNKKYGEKEILSKELSKPKGLDDFVS